MRQLEGLDSFICFVWDNQEEPLLVPLDQYEEVFRTMEPAPDGQYKVRVYLQDAGAELYIANAGRFNVESHFGWSQFDAALKAKPEQIPALTHAHVQTLLGAIGSRKGYEVWVPPPDRAQLEWGIAERFDCTTRLPQTYAQVADVLEAVDVVWLERGSAKLRGLFEVEHSTPIYSGLLRFNDIHLVVGEEAPRFSIVANDERRSVFARQINRPTFRVSGLVDRCGFLEYRDVYGWYQRSQGRQEMA